MSIEMYCPQCSNHCHIDSLHCGRGRKYFANQGIDVNKENSGNREHENREYGNGEHGSREHENREHVNGEHGNREHGSREHENREHGNREHEHRKGGFRGMRKEEGYESGNVRDLFALIAHKLHHQKRGRGAGQGKILNILSAVEQINQKDLQDQLEIQAGSLSEILGKLEKNEWIIREKSEEDKRSAVIKITEKGREALQLIKEEHKHQKDIFSVLNAEEEESLKAILEKLKAQLGDDAHGEMPDGEYRGRCKHGRLKRALLEEAGHMHARDSHPEAHHHSHLHEKP